MSLPADILALGDVAEADNQAAVDGDAAHQTELDKLVAQEAAESAAADKSLSLHKAALASANAFIKALMDRYKATGT